MIVDRSAASGAVQGRCGSRPTSAARSHPRPYSAAACEKSRPWGVAMWSTYGGALPGGRQELEDPAAVVVDQHDHELQAQPRSGEQPADVVGQRDVADQQHDRARAPRRPRRTPSTPSRRCRSRPGSESTRNDAGRAGKNVSTSRTGMDEATIIVASSGSREPSSAAIRGSFNPDPMRRSDRAGGSAVGRVPALQPRPFAALAHQRGELREDRARVGGEDHADRAVGVLPRGLGVEADLQRGRGGEPGAQRLGRRQVTHAQHEIRPHRRSERRRPQQRVVVRHSGGTAARARQRIGQQRHTRAVAERVQRRAEPRVALAAPGDDHGLRSAARLPHEVVDQAGVGHARHRGTR